MQEIHRDCALILLINNGNAQKFVDQLAYKGLGYNVLLTVGKENNDYVLLILYPIKITSLSRQLMSLNEQLSTSIHS